MRLSMLVIIGSAFDGALAQRKKRPNKNRPNRPNKKPQQPRLIPVPMQEEPGFADNRQDIANMLAFKLSQYGYNRHWAQKKLYSTKIVIEPRSMSLNKHIFRGYFEFWMLV